MQKIATKFFICASIIFGVLGIILVFVTPEGNVADSNTYVILHKLLLTTVCVILPSFALSVAGKYLSDKS